MSGDRSRRPAAAPKPNRRDRMAVAASVLVAAAVVATFHVTLGFQFVNWDDDVYVYANDAIRALTPDRIAWMFSHFYYYAFIPVTLLSHAADVAIWGMDPAGHHGTNVLLHAANAVWALWLGLAFLERRSSGAAATGAGPRRGAAGTAGAAGAAGVAGVAGVAGMAVAALLFALHPLRVESVAWVSDRKDLLCAFFLMPAMLAYMRYDARRGTRGAAVAYVLCGALFSLAVLSKSYAVVFPVLLLLFDVLWSRVGLRDERALGRVVEKAPFFLVSAVVTVTSFAHSPNALLFPTIANMAPVERILSVFHLLMDPLFKTVAPAGLSPLYPAPGPAGVLAGAVALPAISAACLVAARRGLRAPALAWTTYLVLLVPNASGLSSGMQPLADRYSYLTTLGLFIAAGGGLTAALRSGGWRRAASVAVAVALLGISFGLTRAQLGHWRSSATLWSRVLEVYPSSPGLAAAYQNLAAARVAEGRLEEARRILERSLAVAPDDAETLVNLGIVLLQMDRAPEARTRIQRAIALAPDLAQAHYYLAAAEFQLGDEPAAVRAMRRAARLGDPRARETLDTSGIDWRSETP